MIQQSQIDLNQMGWQGLTSDLNLPVALPPTGEGVQGLLYDPAITADSDPFSSFTAHATANYALTGHTVSHSALCTPPAGLRTPLLARRQPACAFINRK